MNVLNKIYNIIVIRLAGHEISSRLDEASISYVVEEINEYITRKNIKVDILGVSLGAMIASKFALKYHSKVGKVYMIGPIFGFSIPFFKIGYLMLLKLRRILPRCIYMYFITFAILPGKSEKAQRIKLYNSSKNMDKQFLYSWMEQMGAFILKGEQNLKLTINSQADIKIIYGSKDKIFLGFVKSRLNILQMKKLKIVYGHGHLCNISASNIINKIIEDDDYEFISDS